MIPQLQPASGVAAYSAKNSASTTMPKTASEEKSLQPWDSVVPYTSRHYLLSVPDWERLEHNLKEKGFNDVDELLFALARGLPPEMLVPRKETQNMEEVTDFNLWRSLRLLRESSNWIENALNGSFNGTTPQQMAGLAVDCARMALACLEGKQ
jgi:hypothetical protein